MGWEGKLKIAVRISQELPEIKKKIDSQMINLIRIWHAHCLGSITGRRTKIRELSIRYSPPKLFLLPKSN